MLRLPKIAIFCFVMSLLLAPQFFAYAQKDDAIGVRVMANPQRYSALRWYTEVEKFEGSPQVLTVDGYEAIRDGRTVYVNAGNTNSSGVYYSNIYILSYSQEASQGTSDVFADMLKRWTFNTNMVSDTDFGVCNISTMFCYTDKDCKKGYECRIAGSPAVIAGEAADNKCHLPLEKERLLTCWRDKDCPKETYCTSNKAVITRRARRYANLSDLRSKITAYKTEKGSFPSLLSGSYLPGITLSTWPSWNKTLAADIGEAELPVDPINAMGACPASFNPMTCWNEANRAFSEGNVPNRMVSGPAGSSFYGYYPGTETALGKVYSYSPDGTFSCPLDGSACQ